MSKLGLLDIYQASACGRLLNNEEYGGEND
jgi:hypothetical protein